MTTAPLSLHHLIKPATILKDKTPVLFMLHGYGSNEEDLFSFAAELPEELCVISIRAPYPMQPYGNAWYAINFDAEKGKWSDDQEALLSIKKILNFIEEACNTYFLDKNNVTLLGFSQGAILSYATAISYPEKIKNVIALSGYINENLIDTETDIKGLSHLNIYASHGTVDQVIPVSWAQKTPLILSNLQIKHKYEEFPIGHGVSPQNFYSLKEWLKDKI
ncbi:alpha/beta hydrolase-fold protein [Cellulophaga sp. F20128]|uniref:alpha/beta hydrolase n=1 Tax=Cellulophaga sp. F20128 TaxID=2926413 RepID=UPI001FF694D4|nr:alpha/beta hydrolase-fold protein [Cellulophaga sp. F20128]MCK0156679.1 alpha/beta hydrolase-fold protein [Cellulophaga sp. F20128]